MRKTGIIAKVATTEQTSGSGFDFENKVNAYFLATLLAERFPLDGETGFIRKIEFQVRANGVVTG